MKNWFRNIGYRIQRFMYGRYGYDELSRFLSVFSLILIVLSVFFWPLLIPAWGLMIWSTVRSFSKKLEKRRRERERYLRISSKLKTVFLGPQAKRDLRRNKKRDRKTHRYFSCKKCKTVLRVPKGKGKITITCPKCQSKLKKKT